MRAWSLLLLTVTAAAFASSQPSAGNYTTLQTSRQGSVLSVVINNKDSPINVMSEKVLLDLDHLVTALKQDQSTKAVVFRSGNPLFFVSHFDLLPRKDDPLPKSDPSLAFFGSDIFFNITQLPQVTVAAVDGAARGIGNEFILSCDMRFASAKAVFGNFEASLGGIPGTGGAAYLPILIGRGRAFEYLLSRKDIDARLAAQYGWINKVFESTAELETYVAGLAARVSLFPTAGIASIKNAINSITHPTKARLHSQAADYNRLIRTPESAKLGGRFVALTKNETDIEVELALGEAVLGLYK